MWCRYETQQRLYAYICVLYKLLKLIFKTNFLNYDFHQCLDNQIYISSVTWFLLLLRCTIYSTYFLIKHQICSDWL